MRSFSPILFLGLVLPVAAGQPMEPTDQERLQGAWVLVGLEVRERIVPAEKLAGTTLVIRKDQYTTIVKKKE
jgi:hypothetical protein